MTTLADPLPGAARVTQSQRVPDGAALRSAGATDLLHDLDTSAAGLTSAVALHRLQEHGPNTPGTRTRVDVPVLLLRQFTSPIVLLLRGGSA